MYLILVNQRQNNYNKWLEGAYECFGELGPKQLSINCIAKVTGLPRSNFYYHFPDREIMISQLLEAHIKLSNLYEEDLANNLKVYIPDLHRIIVKYKTGFKFHWQLFKNRNDRRFGAVYESLNQSSSKYILQAFKEYYIPDASEAVANSLWETLVDTWYSRIDFEDFTAESLSRHSDLIMHRILEFKQEALNNSVR